MIFKEHFMMLLNEGMMEGIPPFPWAGQAFNCQYQLF